MTRTVFRATLSLDNTGTEPLENLQVSLQGYKVVDGEQVEVPWEEFNSLFTIGSPETTSPGTGGEFQYLDGSDSLPVGKGFASTWTFVPRRLAAPEAPERYLIGGEISHRNPARPEEGRFIDFKAAFQNTDALGGQRGRRARFPVTRLPRRCQPVP